MSKIDVSIILACYNEGPTFTTSLGKIFEKLKKLNFRCEAIFVEDKSTDKTKLEIKKFNFKGIKIIKIYHKQNFGRGKSVTDGIMASSGKICGFLDVDLEISEDYIDLFVKEIKNGADFVIAKRFYEKNLKSVVRFITSKTYSVIVQIFLKIPVEDTEAGYKFFKKKSIIPVLKKCKSNGWFWDTEISARSYWQGLEIKQIPVIFNRRQDKASTVRILHDSFCYILELIRFRTEMKNYKKVNAHCN